MVRGPGDLSVPTLISRSRRGSREMVCQCRMGNIAEISDASEFAEAESVGMELRLWLNDDDPVSGRLGTDADVAVGFVGWLDRLRRLEDLLAAGRARVTADGSSGQLGAAGDPELGEHV